jgi:hypothetical protein
VPYWEWMALRRDKGHEYAYLFKALEGFVVLQASRDDSKQEDKGTVLDETQLSRPGKR